MLLWTNWPGMGCGKLRTGCRAFLTSLLRQRWAAWQELCFRNSCLQQVTHHRLLTASSADMDTKSQNCVGPKYGGVDMQRLHDFDKDDLPRAVPSSHSKTPMLVERRQAYLSSSFFSSSFLDTSSTASSPAVFSSVSNS